MKELSLEVVGQRIKRVRLQMEMSREHFAEQIGISPQFLAEIENGKKGMSAETLYKLCSRFELSADYILLGRVDSPRLSSPIERSLNRFPESFMVMTEEIISAIEKVALRY